MRYERGGCARHSAGLAAPILQGEAWLHIGVCKSLWYAAAYSDTRANTRCESHTGKLDLADVG
jgi:hypothetical protein